jgi:zinc metalloprotease ZmpB
MSQEFDSEAKAYLTRDAEGTVRDLLHVEEPFESKAGTAVLAAREYLGKYGGVLGIETAELANFSLGAEDTPQDIGVEYRFNQEKPQFDMTTVVFDQTFLGLPVWQAGVSVHMQQKPFVVLSAQSSRHVTINAKMPSKKALQNSRKINAETLAKLLRVSDAEDCDVKSLTILKQRLMIYRYSAKQRVAHADEPSPDARQTRPADVQRPSPRPMLPLPPVGDDIREGDHYVVTEVTFKLTCRGIKDLPWVALIEVETQAVLYLRAFIDNVTGLVFKEDPVTGNGGPLPDAGAAALNALRTSVLLGDVAPPVAGMFALTGDHVRVTDVEVPNAVPPTVAAGSQFDYAARTDNFAAVNAYYHCNRFFELVEDLGFDLPTYFTGTLFPSTVDHRGHYGTANGIEINAYCMGNGTFGIDRTAFMLADLTDVGNPMGLACDWRVVLHELGGHGILYNHVNSANFGFSHSAGDSFAAILNDPETNAADRFQTFPWVYSTIDRRHDRDVTAGWAWGGVNDNGGYDSEQILCTTHFRVYRSIGGDSGELAGRQYAARYMAYLILRTVGSFTQPTNPNNPDSYASAMIAAERGNWTSEDQVGAVYWKVVRWAFEKQGLYQPFGAQTPVVSEGAPPPVDLYIDDGRQGEYPFLAKFWETRDIWNRHEPDGDHRHQSPLVCRKNYAYVRVKNRGTRTSKRGRVSAYHCRPSAGLVWPDDFEPMTTGSLAIPGIPPGGEVVVGPFEWMPVHPGDECMFASVSTSGDRANNDLVTGLPAATGPTPVWRLVPSDNNIAMRSLIPVPGGGGRCALEAAFCNRKFWAQNPFAKPARMEIRAVFPPFWESRGWAMSFNNPGGGTFTLGPRGAREIRPVLLSGRDFSAGELADAGDVTITILVLANGIVVGGLSFEPDPNICTARHEHGKHCTCKHPSAHDCCEPGRHDMHHRCCEPCIDDRCCPPHWCCCHEHHPHHDHDDAMCGRDTKDDPCCNDDDDPCDDSDRLRHLHIEIDLEPKHPRPHEHKDCKDG